MQASRRRAYRPKSGCPSFSWRHGVGGFCPYADAGRTGAGRVLNCDCQIRSRRDFPCRASVSMRRAAIFHIAFDPTLLLRRLVRCQRQISFTHGFGGKLLRQRRRTLRVQGKQQHAAGQLVQSVQQPNLLKAELRHQRLRQADFALLLMHGYAARFVDGDKIRMPE